MRTIIHDQVSHNFIEGPMQDKAAKDSFNEGKDEKAAHHADLTQGYDEYRHIDTMINDSEMPFYEANNRYD